MKCNCNYEFFEQEQHYLCCPNCGSIVKRNLPDNTPMTPDVERAYLKICEFQDYLAWYHNIFLNLLIAIYLGMIIIHFAYYLFNAEYDTNGFSQSFKNAITNRYTIAVYLCVFVFASNKTKYNYYKKYLGECIWHCSTLSYKIIKWILSVFVIALIIKYIFPDILDFLTKAAIRRGVSSYDVKHLMEANYLNIISVALICLATDFEDLYRRNYCTWLNQPYINRPFSKCGSFKSNNIRSNTFKS